MPLDFTLEKLTPKTFHAAVRVRVQSERQRQGVNLERTAVFIAQELPDHRETIIAAAEQAIAGKLILPGTDARPYFVGNPPKWHENPVNDNEYLFGLNRMRHWIPLLHAHALTGQARYAEKVLNELQDWVQQCPRPELKGDPAKCRGSFCGVQPWRALEAGIRMFATWPRVLYFLADSPLLTPERLAAYAASMAAHGEALAGIAPLLWPCADHNHYLMENLGLLVLSCQFPEFKQAENWRMQAMRELERCAQAQLVEDGGQIEGCPHYHNGCVAWFAQAACVAREHGLAFSPEFLARIEKMLDYSFHSCRPTGHGVPWGDSDADDYPARSAVWAFRANASLHWIMRGAKFIDPAVIRRHALAHLWDVPNPRVLLESTGQPQARAKAPALPRVNWQKGLKQVMLRTDWTRAALSVFFACRTPVDNGHAHIDPMGFDFCAYGKALVVDPGRFTYRDDADRRYYKSAAAHNTLTINNRDPFDYVDSWRYTPQKQSEILTVIEAPGLLGAAARHLNYEPALHTRVLALIDDTLLLLIDRIDGLCESDRCQIWLHLDALNAQVSGHNAGFAADDSAPGLALGFSAGLGAQALPGRISEVLDVQRISTRLKLEDTPGVAGTRCYATVLYPVKCGAKMPAIRNVAAKFSDADIEARFDIDGVARRLAFDSKTGRMNLV